MRQNIILKYMIVIVFIAAQLLIVVTLRPAAAAGVAVRTKAPSKVSAIPIDTIVTYTHDPNGNRISESGYIQPPSTTTGVVIGAGVDSLDAGGIDTFVRNEAGQVGVVEVSSEGVVVGAIWLTYNGGAATVDTASSIVGTGVNLLGDGNHNAFLRLGNGQVVVWDINTSGAIVADPWLTLGGAPFQVDLGSAVIASGTDAATHLQDFTMLSGTGETTVYDIGANGALLPQ